MRNRLSLWAEVARKNTEMMLAAGQVIPIRMARMAQAGHTPSASDQREFHRMSAEKLQAGAASAMAVAAQMQAAQLQAGMQLWQNMFMAPWGGARGRPQMGMDSAALARLSGAALAPFHAAATANARRLSGAKAKRKAVSR